METVAIPKRLTQKGELIVVSRKEYERLLNWKKFYEELDKGLDKAIKEYKMGKGYGPFQSVEEGKKFFESRRSNQKRR